MKAIVIKDSQDRVLYCVALTELSTKKFLELEKEAKQTQASNDLDATHWKGRVIDAENNIQELFTECSKLRHEIAVDRGEEDEEPISAEELEEILNENEEENEVNENE